MMAFPVGLMTNNSKKIIFIAQRFFWSKIKRKNFISLQ